MSALQAETKKKKTSLIFSKTKIAIFYTFLRLAYYFMLNTITTKL